jgi:hypothetical protein
LKKPRNEELDMTKLEKATNVAIILACAFLVGTLARNYYLSPQSVAPHPLPEIQKGAVVKLPRAETAGQQPATPTLVLALSKNCHFCQESVGFYQKLAAFKKPSPQGLRLVAVLPQSKDESASYLKEQKIEVDEVVSMDVTKLGVRGTPTLLLLDGQNKLEELWVGKLNGEQESQVIERLKKACAGCSLAEAARRAMSQKTVLSGIP